jgi:palmitoyltransferase
MMLEDHADSQWTGYTPRIGFTLLYVLVIAIGKLAIPQDELTVGVAVPVLGGWHVYLASRGETSIESHDNSYLEGKAKADGLVRSLTTSHHH